MDEKHTYGKEYLLNNLVILFGGRVAEELVLEHTTTGAGNDIEKATDLAHRMVCEWGMSEKLGPMTFGKKEEEIFLGTRFYSKSRLLREHGHRDRRRSQTHYSGELSQGQGSFENQSPTAS